MNGGAEHGNVKSAIEPQRIRASANHVFGDNDGWSEAFAGIRLL
jgi:hypothetical protein